MEHDLEQEFRNVYIGFAENWGFVQALRECFEVSFPNAGDALIPHLDRSVRETMGEAFPRIDPAMNSMVLQRMAGTKIALARSAVDSASVVIIQAALDAVVNDYILLTAEAEPAIWESTVGDDTVPLKVVALIPYPELVRSKALAGAKALGNKALPKKVQWILDNCYRTDCTLSPPDFRFDIERLRKFDDLRHAIAHGRATCATVENMDEVLLFIWQTFLSLQNVVGNRLGFRHDPLHGLDRREATRSVEL